MKKAYAIIMTLLLLCFLFGCAKATDQNSGSTTNDASTTIVNPVQESTAAEILEKLGITIRIPADAINANYSIIEMDGGNSIAQVKFSSGNAEYNYRIQPAAELTDISGAHYDWTTVKKTEVSYCSGELRYIEGKEGICLWYDIVPGLMYCLYADSGASEKTLMEVANKLYVPAQDAP